MECVTRQQVNKTHVHVQVKKTQLQKRKLFQVFVFIFGTVMCAAHTDVAPAKKVNNPLVHSESDFFNQIFFFSRICTAHDSTGSCLFSFKIELLWKKGENVRLRLRWDRGAAGHNVMG